MSLRRAEGQEEPQVLYSGLDVHVCMHGGDRPEKTTLQAAGIKLSVLIRRPKLLLSPTLPGIIENPAK